MESNVNGGKPKDLASYRVDVSPRTAGAVTPNKGGYKIADTGTTAHVGDVYRAESGTAALIGVELMIIEANANDFTVASKVAPTASDTFYILRPITPRYDSTGAQQATIDTTGLATSANQTTQITSLQLLDDVVATTGSAVPAKANLVAGTDGTNARALKTDSAGELQIDVLSSALPSGAATESKQDTINNSINTLLKPADTLAAVTTVSTVSAVTAITNALPAGTNNIGDVDVLTLPPLPAGTNNIGDVDVLTLPSLPAGSNNIGDVDVLTLPSIPAGTNNIGDVDVLTLPAIPAGTNMIGYTTPAPASGNTNPLSRAKTSALDNDIVVKASAGRLYLLVVANTGSVNQYIQIHNASSAPADGTAPEYSFHLPANSSVSLDETLIGDYFSTGIYVCNSTTAATKTIGANDCFITALYL